MRTTDSLRFLPRADQECRRFLTRIARIGIALSLVLALIGVHAALARAEGPGVPGITRTVVNVHQHGDDYPGNVLAMEQAAHLAGHLTGVVDPVALHIVAIDASRTRQPMPAESMPLSTILPAPSEPPRA